MSVNISKTVIKKSATVLKDEREMKKLCNFGFHEKDGSPHICKVNCECEFATFGICNEDGSYGYGTGVTE
jgi:hypothetical protein